MAELIQSLIFVAGGVLMVVYRKPFARQIVEGQKFNFRARWGEREEREIRRVVLIAGIAMTAMALAVMTHALTVLR